MVKESAQNWADLLKSVELHRHRDARYFKPTCLLAVCSSLDKGLDPTRALPVLSIMEEFAALVTPIVPDKAGEGWRPLWHLTSDGPWRCTKMGRLTTRDTFPEGRPKSSSQFRAAVDAIELHEDWIELWKSRAMRDELKLNLCAMMYGDSHEATRRMGHYLDTLFNVPNEQPDFEAYTWTGTGTVFVENLTRYRRHVRVERDTFIIKTMKPLLGYQCEACGFDYRETYGELGAGYIELHHIVPVAEIKGTKKSVEPKEDYAVLCASCHRMIHRLGPPWNRHRIAELKDILRSARLQNLSNAE